ncbi:putative fructokinase [Pseudomonas coronafaciens pv. coronafaciens]|nr:putative fructokinase [Pseudomonas coronafaciens pv. coronafaciens]
MSSYDPNWRNLMDSRYREVTFPAMVSLADIIKLSDEDLRQIYPGLNEEQSLEELRGMNAAAQILFTLGAQGMVLFADNAKVEQAAIAIQVADTVGAGDASMAGWLASQFLGIQQPTHVCSFRQPARRCLAGTLGHTRLVVKR